MNEEEVKKIIKEIELPILTEETDNPRQLYLYKNGKYVDSFDPVYSIKVTDVGLEVEGFLNFIYKRKFNEFTDIKIEEWRRE